MGFGFGVGWKGRCLLEACVRFESVAIGAVTGLAERGSGNHDRSL